MAAFPRFCLPFFFECIRWRGTSCGGPAVGMTYRGGTIDLMLFLIFGTTVLIAMSLYGVDISSAVTDSSVVSYGY